MNFLDDEGPLIYLAIVIATILEGEVTLVAACAYANVSPFKFSTLDTIACFVWALLLLTLVAFVGPTYLARFGLSGWKGALLVGIIIVLVLKFGGLFERRKIEGEDNRQI